MKSRKLKLAILENVGRKWTKLEYFQDSFRNANDQVFVVTWFLGLHPFKKSSVNLCLALAHIAAHF